MAQIQLPQDSSANARIRKNAKRNNVIVFGFALLMSILLTLFYYQLRQQPNKVQVLVAARHINTDEKILPSSISWKLVLPSQVKPEMITNRLLGEQVIGTKAKTPIYAGQPIIFQDVNLIPGGLAARMLDKGTFAVSVNFPADQAMSHLISVGDRINIILSWENKSQSYVKFILQNIKVMSIAPEYQSNLEEDKNGKKNNNLPKTMVLQMTAEQLKKFMLANQIGTTSIVLGSVYSQDKEDHSGILYGNKINPTFHSVPVMKQIETFRGTEKTIKVLP